MKDAAVFIIGAGPVATAMARGLREAGISVLGLWARREEAAREAAKAAGVPCFTALPPELGQADAVLIAVRDAAIAEVAGMLVADGKLRPSVVLLHCSGAQSAQTVFAGLETSIAGGGLLHPLQALASAAPADLSGRFFGVQGDAAGLAMATGLCRALGGRALVLGADAVGSYHAAAAVASNCLVALLDMAVQLMVSAGVDPDLGQEALVALSEGALRNVAERGLPGALTGPIRRGDHDTIAAHLQAIASHLPQSLDLYRAAARWCLPLAAQIGDASPAQLAVIKDLLADGPDLEG